MRAKKILKITSIVVVSLAMLLLFLVAFFLFNPFEGSLPEIRDAVPRSVDFYIHKANLTDDFENPDNFPYIPALDHIGKTPAWAVVKKGTLYRDLGITNFLREVRDGFKRVREDVPFLHPVDDLIGDELQVAGYFGPNGFSDARWCAYSRVSFWGKAAYGAIAHNTMREELRKQGIVIGDDKPFYKIRLPNSRQDYYAVRYLDCVMISNDKVLISDSYELAQGNHQNVEPLGPSAHYLDGVRKPLKRWKDRTEVEKPNVLEMHIQPDRLLAKMPSWRDWPDAKNDDEVNQKILASFINTGSWKFLSGSLIFEPNSLSFLSHLVVNNNKHTKFQNEVFKSDPTSRKEWMDRFFRMVPREACGAAALRLSAGAFIRELVKDALDKDSRAEVNSAIRRTGKYKGLDSLVADLEANLRPRVGVILRPNRRSADSKEKFKVKFESPFPQGAWVFWVRKGNRSGRPLNQPFKDLIHLINQHRTAFAITSAFKLTLAGGGASADVAYEFAIPDIPGTGSIAICTYGEYFIISTSGPLIHSIVAARTGKVRSRSDDPDFAEFVEEMPSALNGVAFAWADQLTEVLKDFEQFATQDSGFFEPAWARDNIPRAEQTVFRRSWRLRYRTIASIPVDSKDKKAFDKEVDEEMRKLWGEHRVKAMGTDIATLKQARNLVQTFRSAYIQMVLDSTSLQIWGRALTPDYRR